MRPDVTVVIPTRDRWDLLATAALPSSLAQEAVDVEVVVVDDGSESVASTGIASLDDPRVRIVRHTRPLGVASARNAGIREASAEWVAFLDDDDIWSPQKLRLQIDAAVTADASFVYGGAAAIAEDRSWLYSLPPVEPEILTRLLLSRNVLWGGSSNVTARADVLRRLDGFDERLFQLCDWDLWIRLALAEKAAAVHDVVVGCIVHPRSMLLVTAADVFEEFSYLRAKHEAASRAYGVELDSRVFTRWVALGHRRAGRRLSAFRTYLGGVVREGDVTSLVRAGAALVGPSLRDDEPPRRPRARSGWSPDLTTEPGWLARYRRAPARTSAHETVSASSPTES